MSNTTRTLTFAAALVMAAAQTTAFATNDGGKHMATATFTQSASAAKHSKVDMKKMADRTVEKIKKAQPIEVGQLRQMRKAQREAEADEKWETLVSEDFSLWSKGTEDAPDSIMYPTTYNEDGSCVLPDSMFHTPGWSGVGLYQAGGNIALAYPNVGGVFNTPSMVMQGKLRVKLRVKAINGSVLFFMNVVAGNWMHPYDPIGYQMNYYNLKPDDGWQDLELDIINTYGGSDCFVQVNGMAYNKGAIIVDSISIERDANFVSTPTGLGASHFTYTGFTTSWDKAAGADSYVVNLYENKKTSDQNFISSNDFEDATVNADGSFTGLGEGWSGRFADEAASPWITDEPFEGDKSLKVASDNDTLFFELPGSYIRDLSFAVKSIKYTEDSYAEINFGFYNGAKWSTFAISATKAADWTTAKFSDVSTFVPGNYTKLRIYGYDFESDAVNGDSTVMAIDDIVVETTPKVEMTQVVKDATTTDTYMAFDNLDTNNEYHFTVQGVTDDGRSSTISADTYAYGVAAPHVLEATNVDKRGAFTANWEAAPNAEAYVLRSYEVYNLPEDKEQYVVFDENFSKNTEGSEDQIKSLENYSYTSLDNYTDNAGWSGNGTILCNGMVGCTYDYYSAYDMLSPEISLNNNGGDYNVTVTFKTLEDGTTLYVQGDNTTYQAIQTDTAGTYTATVKLYGGTRFSHLMFYASSYAQFLLDRVTVTQDLKKGDQLYTCLSETKITDGSTSFRINGLEPDPDYSYAYNLVSYTLRCGTTYRSERSDNQEVKFFDTDGIRTATKAETEGATEIFDLSGRRVQTIGGKGVYIIKNGDKVRKVSVNK